MGRGKETLFEKVGQLTFGNSEKAATRRIYFYGGLGLLGVFTSYGIIIVSFGALIWSMRERSRLGDQEINQRDLQRFSKPQLS